MDHQLRGITTVFPLRVCGGKLLVAVTRERRYGPSRLRVSDDDFLRVSLKLITHSCARPLPVEVQKYTT